MARSIVVNIVGDAHSLTSAVDRSERRLAGLNDRLGILSRGFDRSAGPAVRFRTSLMSVGGVGVAALGGVGVAMAGLGIAGLTMGVKTAAGLEQARIGFEELLGSASEAEKMIEDLKEFAAGTPFELPGLIDAARGLLGAGQAAEGVIPALRDLGDAAGALGLDQERFGRVMVAVTQIMNRGKVSSEELMQITEAGIPVWQLLADALDKPIPKLQEMIAAGKLSADEVLPRLFDQMHKDYGGAMAKQSQTLSGLWSTLMDAINIGLADVIIPLEGKLKGGLKEGIKIAGDALGTVSTFITETLVPNLETLRDWWQLNKDKVELLATTLTNLFSPAAEDAAGSTDDLRQAGEKLSGFLDGVLEVMLRVQQGFLFLALAAGLVARFFLDLGIAVQTAGIAVQDFFGEASEADKQFLEDMKEMRTGTQRNLERIRTDLRKTQDAIDGLHGKTIDIIARMRVNRTNPGFGVFAFQHGTMFVPSTGLAVLHKGEIVIPPRAAERVRSGGALFGATGGGGGSSITVNAVTNASAPEIARELAWALRTSGASA